jgi:hypothetical protein
MAANDKQVGGNHYKKGGEEHWDRAWRLKYDPFQYIITKWVERWRDKGGIQDLEKAKHALEKYIEVVRAESDPLRGPEHEGEGAGPGYVGQGGRGEDVVGQPMATRYPYQCPNCCECFEDAAGFLAHLTANPITPCVR